MKPKDAMQSGRMVHGCDGKASKQGEIRSVDPKTEASER